MAAVSKRLTNLNWISVIVYPMSVILMEALWVYPWLVWTGKYPDLDWFRTPLTLASVIFITGAAFFIARYFPDRKRRFLWIQLGIVMLLILAVVSIEFGVPFSLSGPFITAVVAGFYLSWRGINFGRSRLFFGDVARHFIIGMAALVLLIIVWEFSLGTGSFESLASTVGIQVAGFFFFGLLSLALGNLQDIQRQGAAGDKAPLSIRRWVPIQLGVVAGIILLGLGIASIFSSDLVALLARFISFIYMLIARALFFLMYPFEWLAQGVGFLVEWLVNLFQGGKPQQIEAPAFFGPTELQDVPDRYFPPEIIVFLKWGFFIIAAIVVVIMLIRALSRYRAVRADAEVDETQESLGSWQGLKADIRLLFSLLRQRLKRRRRRPAMAGLAPDWYLGDDTEGELEIREIYRRLLGEAADYGVARRSYETPGEYARRLGETVPHTGEELDELTGIYIDHRYGEKKTGVKQAEKANGLWRILRGLLRKPTPDAKE